jgi:hypothetical protein
MRKFGFFFALASLASTLLVLLASTGLADGWPPAR